jgi:hypothetical protein
VEHPKTIGDRTTLAVMYALHSAGFALYMPFGENTRADLIVDDGSTLARVQCKTGRLRDGAVRFATCSTYAHHRSASDARRDYLSDVDAFAVYCPETTAVYFVPIDALPVRTRGALRVAPCRNNQRLRVRFAAEFEVGRVGSPSTGGPGGSSGGSGPCA